MVVAKNFEDKFNQFLTEKQVIEITNSSKKTQILNNNITH